MHVTVNSQTLAAELRALSKVVPSKPAIAILSHALLTASGDELTLYATDLEVGLRSRCPAQVDAGGTVALPLFKFLSMVEQFPDADVLIAVDHGGVTVKCQAFTSKVQVMPADDFPRSHEPEGEACTLDAASLLRLINATRYAVAESNSKHSLRGALLTLSGGVGAMVATDGRRLALSTMARVGSDVSTVVPAKAIDTLSGLIEGGTEVTLTVGRRHLFFAMPGRLLTSRTIDGEFPKYERIIPRDNDKAIVVNRGDLAAALRRILVAAEDNKAVKVYVQPGALELTSSSAEVGTAHEVVRTQYDGEELRACVNGGYVLDFLNASLDQNVTVALKDAKSAMLLTEGTDHVGVIMLMRA